MEGDKNAPEIRRESTRPTWRHCTSGEKPGSGVNFGLLQGSGNGRGSIVVGEDGECRREAGSATHISSSESRHGAAVVERGQEPEQLDQTENTRQDAEH